MTVRRRKNIINFTKQVTKPCRKKSLLKKRGFYKTSFRLLLAEVLYRNKIQ